MPVESLEGTAKQCTQRNQEHEYADHSVESALWVRYGSAACSPTLSQESDVDRDVMGLAVNLNEQFDAQVRESGGSYSQHDYITPNTDLDMALMALGSPALPSPPNSQRIGSTPEEGVSQGTLSGAMALLDTMRERPHTNSRWYGSPGDNANKSSRFTKKRKRTPSPDGRRRAKAPRPSNELAIERHSPGFVADAAASAVLSTGAGKRVTASPTALKRAEALIPSAADDGLTGGSTQKCPASNGFGTGPVHKRRAEPLLMHAAANDASLVAGSGAEERAAASNAPVSVGFSTGAGKTVRASAAAMKRAEAWILAAADDDSVVPVNGAEERAVASNAPPVSVGLSTGAGKNVRASAAAMKRAEALIHAADDDSVLPGNGAEERAVASNAPPVSVGFSTGAGRNVRASAAAMKRAEALIRAAADDLPANGAEERVVASNAPPVSVGFSTGAGRNVRASTAAMKRAEVLIHAAKELAPVRCAPTGFNTGAGQTVAASPAAMMRAEALVRAAANDDDTPRAASTRDPVNSSASASPMVHRPRRRRLRGTPLHRGTGRGADTPLHRAPSTPLHRAPGTPLHRGAGTPMHRGAGTPLHRAPGTPLHRGAGLRRDPSRTPLHRGARTTPLHPRLHGQVAPQKNGTSSPFAGDDNRGPSLTSPNLNKTPCLTSPTSAQGISTGKREVFPLSAMASSERISLAEFEAQFPSVRKLDANYALRCGVSQAALHMDLERARGYEFRVMYSGRPPPRGVHSIDWMMDALVASGAKKQLLSREWVLHHYGLIVWKLASMERFFPERFGGALLKAPRVLQELRYRYEREVNAAQRSPIKQIVEHDANPARLMVLCVSGISSGGTPSPQVQVTDGWYCVSAALDAPLQQLLQRGQLFEGVKLVVHGAKLLGCDSPCEPLSLPSSVALQLHYNGVRKAAWHLRLGFLRPAAPFCLPLQSLRRDGGGIPCIDVVILRKYPRLYLDKSGGRTVSCSHRGHELRELQHQQRLERLYAKLTTEHHDNGGDLSEEQARWEIEAQVKAEIGEREVTPLQRFLVADASRKNGQGDPTLALLTIWRPGESTSDVSEGSRLMIFDTTAVARRFVGSTLLLDWNRRTTFKVVPFSGQETLFPHILPRRVTAIADLPARLSNREFDVVGVFVAVQEVNRGSDGVDHHAFISGVDRSLLAVRFPAVERLAGVCAPALAELHAAPAGALFTFTNLLYSAYDDRHRMHVAEITDGTEAKSTPRRRFLASALADLRHELQKDGCFEVVNERGRQTVEQVTHDFLEDVQERVGEICGVKRPDEAYSHSSMPSTKAKRRARETKMDPARGEPKPTARISADIGMPPPRTPSRLSMPHPPASPVADADMPPPVPPVAEVAMPPPPTPPKAEMVPSLPDGEASRPTEAGCPPVARGVETCPSPETPPMTTGACPPPLPPAPETPARGPAEAPTSYVSPRPRAVVHPFESPLSAMSRSSALLSPPALGARAAASPCGSAPSPAPSTATTHAAASCPTPPVLEEVVARAKVPPCLQPCLGPAVVCVGHILGPVTCHLVTGCLPVDDAVRRRTVVRVAPPAKDDADFERRVLPPCVRSTHSRCSCDRGTWLSVQMQTTGDQVVRVLFLPSAAGGLVNACMEEDKHAKADFEARLLQGPLGASPHSSQTRSQRSGSAKIWAAVFSSDEENEENEEKKEEDIPCPLSDLTRLLRDRVSVDHVNAALTSILCTPLLRLHLASCPVGPSDTVFVGLQASLSSLRLG